MLTKTRMAILLAVGPGDVELNRLADLGASLSFYAPEVDRLLIVDDANRPDALVNSLAPSLQIITQIIPNPRFRDELGWREGLTIGIWAGLANLAKEGYWDFVLKLDTDSLIIGPPINSIASFISSHMHAGLIGTTHQTPAGLDTKWSVFAPWVRLLKSRFCFYRDPVTQRRKFRWGLGNRAHRQRKLLKAALAQSYQPGEHCQGGGYALTGHALDALAQANLLRDPFLWSKVPITEDVALALCVCALGFKLQAANKFGDPIGVQYTGLAFPPNEMIDRGYTVIHSLKNDLHHSEKELRTYFAKLRR